MMTAAAYVSQIVEPTIEEFRQDRDDLRRAMLASMAVLHVVDFVMQNRAAAPDPAKGAAPKDGNRMAGEFKDRIAGTHVGFDTVNKFALASKHGVLRRDPGFDTDRHVVAPPAFADEMVCDASFLDDEIGGVTIKVAEGAFVNLSDALDAAMALYQAEFPEAFVA